MQRIGIDKVTKDFRKGIHEDRYQHSFADVCGNRESVGSEVHGMVPT